MIKSRSKKFNKPLYVLHPGEYYATNEDCVLGTVAGLCVAVCLYDPVRKMGGMGHFIVPGVMGTEGLYRDEIASRGIASMEHLIGEIVKLGGDRKYLCAKIFGAGYAVDDRKKTIELSEGNIHFIQEYFVAEKIIIDRIDLGGEFRRRLYFFPNDGNVYRKILKNNEEESEFIRMEKDYIEREFINREKAGKVILFQ
jgi:chemotaxis protein CheD